jgi:hypothetical protein
MPPEENSLDVLPLSSIAGLERAQIDSQIATAHAYPRSLEQFQKRAISMATLDLTTAESCIYSRPVGGGKTAEGESIRMAEIVAACYGNLRVAARIIEQTPRLVRCEGVAHDLESNYAGKSECVEATVTKEGKPYSESQRAVMAKACLAKAYRDAVFKVVPKSLCKAVTLAARGVINKEIATLEQRQARVKAWLKQIKVTDARVFAVLGVKGWADVNDEHLLTITGLRTAINEQETTVEEAFPSTPVAPKLSASAAGKAELFPTRLDELKAKLTGEVTEARLLDYLRSMQLCDDSLSSLAEVFAQKPSAVDAVLMGWPHVEKRIKKTVESSAK